MGPVGANAPSRRPASSDCGSAVSILVIEDYEPLRKSLTKGLREEGYAVDSTGDGEEGLWFASSNEYDVIVLDLMLPKIDGLTILQELRKRDNPVHVLILTAKDTLPDRVRGLNLGADDYLVKPFAFAELLARVRALLRRKYESKSPVITSADIEIDTRTRTASRAGKTISLTAREYAILEYLALREGQLVTRSEIWDHVYDWAADANSNVVDVYIGHLRRKLEQGGASRLIHTRRGLGYVFGETD
jgi:DNA-binding response OmpR family regulator